MYLMEKKNHGIIPDGDISPFTGISFLVWCLCVKASYVVLAEYICGGLG